MCISLVNVGLYFKVKCKMEDDGTPPRLYFKVKCKMEDDGTPPLGYALR